LRFRVEQQRYFDCVILRGSQELSVCEWVAWQTCWRTRDELKLSISSFGFVEALCVLVQDLQRCSDSTRTFSLSFFLLPLRSVSLIRGSVQWGLWCRYMPFISLIVVEIRSLRLLTCFFSFSGDPWDPPLVFGFVAAWLLC
jgi:hypothetical protein